jgi:hypothetical protein
MRILILLALCAGCAGTRTEVAVSYYHSDGAVTVRVAQ